MAAILRQTKCSAALNRQFVEHPNKPSKGKRVVLRKIRELPPKHEEELEISCETVSRVIKDAKNSKAIGPDGIAKVMLKHLKYLTKTFNICLQSLEIPDMWKQGKIIPIPKPDKPSNQGSSYRPITPLSPITLKLTSHFMNTNMGSEQAIAQQLHCVKLVPS